MQTIATIDAGVNRSPWTVPESYFRASDALYKRVVRRRGIARPLHETWTSITQRHLASVIGVSERTVRSALAWLEAQGGIRRRRQPIATGGRRADLIIVHRARLRSLIRMMRAGLRRARVAASVYYSSGEEINRSPNGGRYAPITRPLQGETDMSDEQQGSLFSRRRQRSTKRVDPDSTMGRWYTYSRMYKAKYGHAPVAPNMAQTMATIKRLKDAIPSVDAWAEVVGAYLRQRDDAVVAARHPVHWLHRRAASILPTVQRQIVERERQRAADNAERERMARLIEEAGGTVNPEWTFGEMATALQAARDRLYAGYRERVQRQRAEESARRRADIIARFRAMGREDLIPEHER